MRITDWVAAGGIGEYNEEPVRRWSKRSLRRGWHKCLLKPTYFQWETLKDSKRRDNGRRYEYYPQTNSLLSTFEKVIRNLLRRCQTLVPDHTWSQLSKPISRISCGSKYRLWQRVEAHLEPNLCHWRETLSCPPDIMARPWSGSPHLYYTRSDPCLQRRCSPRSFRVTRANYWA